MDRGRNWQAAEESEMNASAGRMFHTEDEERDSPSLGKELDSLFGLRAELAEVAEQLEKVLGPILGPENPEGEADGPAQMKEGYQRSSYVELVREEQGRVRKLKYRLVKLLERVEL